MSNKTQLSAEQEERLLKDLSMTNFSREALLNFARLYHTAASQSKPLGEVRTAEEIWLDQVKKMSEDKPVANIILANYIFAAMLEYHAQFQQGWMDIASAPKDGTGILMFIPGDLNGKGSVCLGTYNHFIKYGDDWVKDWITIDGTLLQGVLIPTHWQPLPSPPNDKP